MAKKIEGYVDGEGDGPEFTPYKEGNKYFPFWEAQGITLKPRFSYWRKAVVIVTEERVFTASEVQSVIDAIAGLAQGYWESSGPGGPDMLSVGEIESECARIGIVPDPA